MQLVKHSTIATLMLVVIGLLLTASFGWPVEAGLRVFAFLGSGVWAYALVAQIFLMQAHTQGEINRSLNEWHMTLPLPARGLGGARSAAPNQLLDAPVLHDEILISNRDGTERLIPIRSTNASRITPVEVAKPTDRMLELPDGRRISRADVTFFVDNLDKKGHGRKEWVGQKMPSGKVVDSVYLQPLIAAVRMSGEFEKYGQGIRSRRSLSTQEIKQRLHLDT